MEIPKGNQGLQFINSMKRDPLNFFVNLAEENEDYTWFKMPGKNILFLSNAQGIKHVLQTNYQNYWKGKYNQVLKPIFGKGIFLAEGDEWKSQKKLSAPAFAGKHFPGMSEEMIASAELMFARIDDKIKGGPHVDVYLELMWFTLDVVLRALFDTRKENIAFDVKENLATLLEEAEHRIWAVLPLPQKLALSLPRYKTARDRLVNIVSEIIDDGLKVGNKDDLLTTFKTYYSTQNERETILVDQVMSFLLAGHETTANALAWAFYELARRPALQEMLLEEVDSVLGNQPLTFEKIKELKLVKSYFNEILRLYPPVWSMSREALGDDIIPLGERAGVELPKDATVMMCTYAMHRNTKYWNHPEALIPDRFTGPPGQYGYAFFPFGGGPRLCLGHKFAEIESVIMLVMFLQRYSFSLMPGQNIVPVPAITLKPSREILFNLQRKEQKPSEIWPVNLEAVGGRCPVHA